jgi:hypothetical protein
VSGVVDVTVAGTFAAGMTAAGGLAAVVSTLGILDYMKPVLVHDLVDPPSDSDDG